jgi:hypothetical protein
MTLHSTRPAMQLACALALFTGLSFSPALAPAQSSAATSVPGFVPGPSNPAPPYPPGMILTAEASNSLLPVVPMPPDRAADSYKIYSALLPVGDLANPGWTRDMWLLSDTTLTLVPANQSCLPQGSEGTEMNPHVAVQPPVEGQQDFAEMLDDFDRRCHERVHLTAESFNLVVPLKLLNPAEQDEFILGRFDPNAGPEADRMTARYKGAPGLSRFSEVYFNAHHTVGMVYASGWCGGLCSQSYWQVLKFEDGVWKRLDDWHSASLMD